MLSLEQAIEIAKNSNTNLFDGRTLKRMSLFMTAEQIESCGFEFNTEEDKNNHTPLEYTEEAVLNILKDAVAFGFEKALNQRGISSGLMYTVVHDFNQILDNELKDWDTNNYAQYGLPLFKATAELYGWDNPIGEDTGTESKYSSW